MQLPFSAAQFLEVFARYNQAVWPLQIVWNVLALLAIGLAVRKARIAGRAISLVLALLWLWIGVVYHWLFFSPINPVAKVFGVLFVLEGLLFLWFGVRQSRLSFQPPRGATGMAGLVLILYALLIYPLIGAALGHGYPYAPTFGLPCPTTIFTFGLLLWLERRPPWALVAIPMLWSLLGLSAALQLGIREDLGLIVSALIMAASLLMPRANHASRHPVP